MLIAAVWVNFRQPCGLCYSLASPYNLIKIIILWHGSTKGWHCGTQTIVQRSSGDWSFVLCTQANFHPGRHSIPPDLGWCYSRVLFDSYQFHFHTKGMLCHYRYRPCKYCMLTAAVIPRGIVSQSLWSRLVSWFKTSSSNSTILKIYARLIYTLFFFYLRLYWYLKNDPRIPCSFRVRFIN